VINSGVKTSNCRCANGSLSQFWASPRGSPHPTVPLLCPYDSVFVSIHEKTVFNVFNQSGPISTPQYAPNAIVVLDVVGSNPTSRPRINSLQLYVLGECDRIVIYEPCGTSSWPALNPINSIVWSYWCSSIRLRNSTIDRPGRVDGS